MRIAIVINVVRLVALIVGATILGCVFGWQVGWGIGLITWGMFLLFYAKL